MPLLPDRTELPPLPLPPAIAAETQDGAINPKRTKVFYIPFTGEIILDYDDFLARSTLYKKKVWICEMTGKANLSYQEAIASEAVARKKADTKFPECWRRTALLRIHWNPSTLLETQDDLINHFSTRFFINELVGFESNGDVYNAVILEIHVLDPVATSSNGSASVTVNSSEKKAGDEPHVDDMDTDENSPTIQSEGSKAATKLINGTQPPSESRRVIRIITSPSEEPPLSSDALYVVNLSTYDGKLLQKEDDSDFEVRYTTSADKLLKNKIALTKQNIKSFIKEYAVKESWGGAPWQVKQELVKRYRLPVDPPPGLPLTLEERKKMVAVMPAKKRLSKKLPSLKNPIEDLDLPLVAPRPLTDLTGAPLPPRPEGVLSFEGVPPELMCSLIHGWQFLSSFSKPLSLFPFTLQDLLGALNHRNRLPTPSPQTPCNLLVEIFGSTINLACRAYSRGLETGTIRPVPPKTDIPSATDVLHPHPAMASTLSKSGLVDAEVAARDRFLAAMRALHRDEQVAIEQWYKWAPTQWEHIPSGSTYDPSTATLYIYTSSSSDGSTGVAVRTRGRPPKDQKFDSVKRMKAWEVALIGFIKDCVPCGSLARKWSLLCCLLGVDEISDVVGNSASVVFGPPPASADIRPVSTAKEDEAVEEDAGQDELNGNDGDEMDQDTTVKAEAVADAAENTVGVSETDVAQMEGGDAPYANGGDAEHGEANGGVNGSMPSSRRESAAADDADILLDELVSASGTGFFSDDDSVNNEKSRRSSRKRKRMAAFTYSDEEDELEDSPSKQDSASRYKKSLKKQQVAAVRTSTRIKATAISPAVHPHVAPSLEKSSSPASATNLKKPGRKPNAKKESVPGNAPSVVANSANATPVSASAAAAAAAPDAATQNASKPAKGVMDISRLIAVSSSRFSHLSAVDRIDILTMLIHLVGRSESIVKYVDAVVDKINEIKRLLRENVRERKAMDLAIAEMTQKERIAKRALKKETGAAAKAEGAVDASSTAGDKVNGDAEDDDDEDEDLEGGTGAGDDEDDEDTTLGRRSVKHLRAKAERARKEAELRTKRDAMEETHGSKKENLKAEEERKKLSDASTAIALRNLALHMELNILNGICRVAPLGHDRNHNSYWWFDGALGSLSPADAEAVGLDFRPTRSFNDTVVQISNLEWNSGCLFVEDVIGSFEAMSDEKKAAIEEGTVPGTWRVYQTKEEIDQLKQYLDGRGIRENELLAGIEYYYEAIVHGMKKRIEDEENPSARRPLKKEDGSPSYMRYINPWCKLDGAQKLP